MTEYNLFYLFITLIDLLETMEISLSMRALSKTREKKIHVHFAFSVVSVSIDSLAPARLALRANL